MIFMWPASVILFNFRCDAPFNFPFFILHLRRIRYLSDLPRAKQMVTLFDYRSCLCNKQRRHILSFLQFYSARNSYYLLSYYLLSVPCYLLFIFAALWQKQEQWPFTHWVVNLIFQKLLLYQECSKAKV